MNRLLLLPSLLFLQAVQAHKLEQVVVEMEVRADGWRATSDFEALYALDDLIRETVPASYDLAWLNSREDAELYRLIRLVTESFYEERFRVTVDGVLRPINFEFPDYEGGRPVFTEDESGTPVVRVVMEGAFGKESGPVLVKWNASEKPHLVLSPKAPGVPERRVLLVKAGDEVELARPVAVEEEPKGEPPAEDRRSSPTDLRSVVVVAAVVLVGAGLFLLVRGQSGARGS